MFDDDDTTPEHERRITRCREPSCNARIIWLENPATGKRVPVEADDEDFDGSRHVSHFKTCTAPNRFSKGAKRE